MTLVNWGFTLEVLTQHKTDKATPLSLEYITSRLLPKDVLSDIWDKPANAGPITRKPVESAKDRHARRRQEQKDANDRHLALKAQVEQHESLSRDTMTVESC